MAEETQQDLPQDLPELTDKQEMFCRQYIIDFNGAQAAIRAGYSANSAKEIASETLTKPNVKARIEYLKSHVFEAVGITQASVYQELARIAMFDIRKAYNENGSLKKIHELDDNTAAAVSGVKVNEIFEGSGEDRTRIGETVELKLTSKIAAIENIVKIAGWNAPVKNEVSGPGGGPIQTANEHQVTFKDFDEPQV